MSALISYVQRRVNTKLFLLFASIFAVFFLFPHPTLANELPAGVLEQNTCDSYTVNISGYGAGMMYNVNPIEISNRRVSYISPTQGCAVVEWDSSVPAASQVLFGELNKEPVSIDLSSSTYGYESATTQNNAGLANHRAILTGLEAGKAYSYRLVTRTHPSALPSISDAHVLIAGPIPTITQPTPDSTQTVPPVVNTFIPPVVEEIQYDAEKFPIRPTVDESSIGSDTEEEVETASNTQEALPEASIATTTLTVSDFLEEGHVPSAINAATQALKDRTEENSLWQTIKDFFLRMKPSNERLSLTSNIGLFATDRYIIPTLFFLGLLFLLQQLVLPAFGVSLKNPILYWLFGTIVLAVVSALFMLYYITLVGIVLFLALLAWYLVQNTPSDKTAASSSETKLLEVAGSKAKALEEKKKADN